MGIYGEALKKGGAKAFFIGVILSVAYTLAITAVAPSVLSGRANPDAPASLKVMLVLVLLVLIGTAFIYSGMWGSYKDAVEGRKVTFKSYVSNASDLFVRFCAYGLAYGISGFIIVVILMAVINPGWLRGDIPLIPLPPQLLAVEIGFMVLYSMTILPLWVLKVVNCDKKGFLYRNFASLTLYCVGTGILLFIPVAGSLLTTVAQLLYPLYILCLRQGSGPHTQVEQQVSSGH